MKTSLHFVLLLAVVVSTGDLLLRQLPERVLADLNQQAMRTVPASAVALTRVSVARTDFTSR